MRDLEVATALLHHSPWSLLAVREGQTIYTTTGNGVKPLLEAPGLQGAAAADRVVGRAAALLLVGLGVVGVHACTLSQGGERILRLYGLPYTYDRRVEYIKNQAGTDRCPFERAVEGVEDPEEAVRRLKALLL